MDTEKINELKQTARTVENEGTPFMEPQIKVKKKIGRPKGSTKKESSQETAAPHSQPTGPVVPTATMIKPAVNLLSGAAVAYTRAKEAAMSEAELEAASQALGALIDKWAPDALNKWGPEIVTILIFGQYGLRVMQIKKLVDAAEIQNKTAPADGKPFSESNLAVVPTAPDNNGDIHGH